MDINKKEAFMGFQVNPTYQVEYKILDDFVHSFNDIDSLKQNIPAISAEINRLVNSNDCFGISNEAKNKLIKLKTELEGFEKGGIMNINYVKDKIERIRPDIFGQ